VVLALRAPRRLARLLNGGQQQRDQNGDNRDHDQQLNQRETCPSNDFVEERHIHLLTGTDENGKRTKTFPIGSRPRLGRLAPACLPTSAWVKRDLPKTIEGNFTRRLSDGNLPKAQFPSLSSVFSRKSTEKADLGKLSR